MVGRLLLTAKTPTYVNGQYIQYTATGTAAPYPTNNLRFNLNGSAVGLSLVAGLIDLSLGFYGQNAEYWTSTKLLNIPGSVSKPVDYANNLVNLNRKKLMSPTPLN
ncbi:hypothetical protein [Sphingobacterium multivorum]|uniref:hypothetical protein n=1 Tax=Sphingobacterium multivorum TaxID=28454 RepID=UPI003DA5A38D